MKRILCLFLAVLLTLSLCACGAAVPAQTEPSTQPAPQTAPVSTEAPSDTITVTDMIGRSVQIQPGSYQRVVCIGAGALRMYSYVGDTALLCGVEDMTTPPLPSAP